jgi:hypothetical protein
VLALRLVPGLCSTRCGKIHSRDWRPGFKQAHKPRLKRFFYARSVTVLWRAGQGSRKARRILFAGTPTLSSSSPLIGVKGAINPRKQVIFMAKPTPSLTPKKLLAGELAGQVATVCEKIELLRILIDRGQSGESLTLSFSATIGMASILREIKDQLDAVDSILMEF